MASSSCNRLSPTWSNETRPSAPEMDEVVARFAEMRSKVSTWKLRSQLARNKEIWLVAAGGPFSIGTLP